MKSREAIDAIPVGIQDEGWAFLPDGHSVVVADAAKAAIRTFDLRQGTQLHQFPIPNGAWVRGMVCVPGGDAVVVAYANSGEVELRRLSDGAVLDQWRVPSDIFDLDAGAGGEIAIAAGEDVYLFRQGVSQAVGIVRAHDARVDRIRFTRRGDRFATHCNSHQLKVWDVSTNELLMQASATRHIGFVRDDTEIAGVFPRQESEGPGFAIASFEKDKLCRQIGIADTMGGVRSVALSDDGTQLFAATDAGTAKAHLGERVAEAVLIDPLPCAGVCTVGEGVFSSRRFCLTLRPLANPSPGESGDVGQSVDVALSDHAAQQVLGIATSDHHYGSALAVDSTGTTIAAIQKATGEILVVQGSRPPKYLQSPGFECVALSPDGQFLACSRSQTAQVTKVWDLNDSRAIKEIPFAANNVAFIGSEYVLLGGSVEYGLYDLAASKIVNRFPRSHQSVESPIAVCEALNVAAIVTNDISIDVYDTDSWSKLFSIPMDAVNLRELTLSKNGGVLAGLNRDGSIDVLDLRRFATEFESHGLDWPIAAVDQELISFESLPSRAAFNPMPNVDWMSGARSIRKEAAPVHRAIEALLIEVTEPEADVSADKYQSLAHKYLHLGGLHEARRYFQKANAAEQNAERIYFAGLLSVVIGDQAEYLRLRKTIDVDMVRRTALATTAARLCLLRPDVDPEIMKAIIETSRERIALDRPGETQWLKTTLALALVRDNRADEAVVMLRDMCDNEFDTLDVFEKAVTALALRRSGQTSEAEKVTQVVPKIPPAPLRQLATVLGGLA